MLYPSTSAPTFKRVKRQQNMSVLLLNYVWCTSLHKWFFFFFFYWITSIGVQIRDHTRVFKTTAYTYVTYSAKRCANFWLSIKSVSNTLSCCCFVCAFIIRQYYSRNNMSSKSGAAGEILFFESEKHHGIWPLKMDTLTVSAFDVFIHVPDKSKHYLSHQFTQRRYHFTQCI